MAFANELVKDIIDEQSASVRDFVTGLIQDTFRRYRPELVGELRTRVVQGGLELSGQGIRLDLKHRDTGVSVSSLDIPVSIMIKVDPLGVTLQDATISLGRRPLVDRATHLEDRILRLARRRP